MYGKLMAGLIVAACMAGSVSRGQPAGRAPVSESDDELARKGASPPRPPLPASGSTATFSYQASDIEGVYTVTPVGGEFSFQVSESFLGLVVDNQALSDQQRAIVLSQYPTLVSGTYSDKMVEAYPTAADFDGTPFRETTITGNNGDFVVIQQDPLAGPYARVTLKTANGEVQTFSLNRAILEYLLSNTALSADQIIEATKKYIFRLPDDARYSFNTITHSNIVRLASELPEIKRQEFVWMHKVLFETTNTPPTNLQALVVGGGRGGGAGGRKACSSAGPEAAPRGRASRKARPG